MKKENKLALQQNEMRMIKWMCGVKITGKFTYSELRERQCRGTSVWGEMVWASFKKGQERLGEKMHGLWSESVRLEADQRKRWLDPTTTVCKKDAMDHRKWRKCYRFTRIILESGICVFLHAVTEDAPVMLSIFWFWNYQCTNICSKCVLTLWHIWLYSCLKVKK